MSASTDIVSINDTKINFKEMLQPREVSDQPKKVEERIAQSPPISFKKSWPKLIPQKTLIEKENDIQLKQEKIYTIQKYQASKRFGEYIRQELRISHTSAQLNKMSNDELQEILEKIRIHLDNRNLDKFYDNMALKSAQLLETSITPFYKINGFANNLFDDEEFLNIWERFKIENKMITIPAHIQLTMIVGTILMKTRADNRMQELQNDEEYKKMMQDVEDEIQADEDKRQLSNISKEKSKEKSKEIIINDVGLDL